MSALIPRLSLLRNKRRAVILVLSMWLVLVLSLLAYSLAEEMRVELKLTRGHRDQFVAEQLTRIGVARALADLRNDRLMDYCRNESGELFDALGDVWAGRLGARSYEAEGVGRYEILLADEESKIDLNSASPESRLLMRNLLVFLKVDERTAQDLADVIWDWKDADNDPVAAPGQTEVGYYTARVQKMRRSSGGRAQAGVVYPKNAPFNTVDELLQIPGMTPQLFYGYDPEKEEAPPFFPERTMRAYRKRLPGLRDLVTVRTHSLNVNTAGFEVLAALCGYATKNLDSGRSLAEKIIAFRQGGRVTDINNSHAFRRIEDLELVTGLSGGFISLMRQAAPQLTTFSDNFTIYCRAEAGKKRTRTYGSGSSRSEQQPLPSARVVVQCIRGTLTYDAAQFKERNPPPGCRRPMDLRGPVPIISPTNLQWFVPVVYLQRWVSD